MEVEIFADYPADSIRQIVVRMKSNFTVSSLLASFLVFYAAPAAARFCPWCTGDDEKLFEAARQGDIRSVEHILDAKGGAIMNCSMTWTPFDINNTLVTILHAAAFNGHTKIVKELLARGAEVDIDCYDSSHDYDRSIYYRDGTPLYFASRAGQTAVVKILLRYGADSNFRCGNCSGSPAEVAASDEISNLFEQDKRYKEDPSRFVSGEISAFSRRQRKDIEQGMIKWPNPAIWGNPKRLTGINPANDAFKNMQVVAQGFSRNDLEHWAGAKPKPPMLTQGPYESQQQFEMRVPDEKEAYLKAAAAYRRKVEDYQDESHWRRNAMVEAALSLVFREPRVSRATYDPNLQLFSAEVTSDSPYAGDFKATFVLVKPLPNRRAAAFEQGLKDSIPEIHFRLKNGILSLESASFNVLGKNWSASPVQAELVAGRVGMADLSSADQGLASVQPGPEEGLIIHYTNPENPEIVTKKRELEALRKRKAEALQLKALETELARLKEETGKAYVSDVDVADEKQPENPKKFAVIVGIESYQDGTLPRAEFAERDVRAVEKHLLALGVPLRNLRVLLGSNATKAKLEGVLEDWLPRNIFPDSEIFFYFSGHGAPDPANGTAYLVPWDGDPSLLKNTGFALSDLYADMDRLQAKKQVAVLDSCFSGMGGRSLLAKGSRPFVLVHRQKMGLSSKLAVLTATSDGQTTSGLESQGHGLFTYYFLKALQSGNRSTSSIFSYIKPKIGDAARRQNRDQVPMFFGPDSVVP